jgi:hypothetical protein
MKKILLATMAIALMMFAVSCEDDDNTNEPTVIEPMLEITDAVETVTGLIAFGGSTLESICTLTNTGEEAVQVKLNIELVSVTAGHTVEPCFAGNCLPPVTESKELNQILTLQPGESTDENGFICHVSAHDVVGESVVKFTFIPLDEDGEKLEDISVYYTCTFTFN